MSDDTLIPDRPPSINAQGDRQFILSANVKGPWRTARTWCYWGLIGLFLVVPWTTFRGQQTILLHLPTRQFTFFGFTFYAHDGPLLFFLLAILVFTLAFVTSLWGRVWCGWACPQTVFIDRLFLPIETWIEGNAAQRKKLQQGSWTFSKVRKKVLKWTVFALIASHISHSFTAYFVGASELFKITLESPSHNWGLFLFVQIFSLILLLDFGWFREQFCLIACPYGRFQSVLMDKDSMAVLYDTTRGEPRRKKGQDSAGDCIDCGRCVQVCPTGIDIRNGIQLECIACTACIDACDEIMEKVKKPKGLIRYMSESESEGKTRKTWSGRSITHGVLLCVLVMSFALVLSLRKPLDIKALRAIEAPYQLLPNGRLSNHFRFHVSNQSQGLIEIVKVSASEKQLKVVAPTLPLKVNPGKSEWIHVFIESDLQMVSDKRAIDIVLSEKDRDWIKSVDLLGPMSN